MKSFAKLFIVRKNSADFVFLKINQISVLSNLVIFFQKMSKNAADFVFLKVKQI